MEYPPNFGRLMRWKLRIKQFVEKLCLKVGFNERQTVTLISGKSLFCKIISHTGFRQVFFSISSG